MRIAIAIATAAAVMFGPPRLRTVGALAGVGAMVHPLLSIVAIAAWVAVDRARRLNRNRSRSAHDHEHQILAVELVSMGLAAGVPFDVALMHAARHVDAPTGDQIRRELRQVRHVGQGVHREGPVARMFGIAVDSEVSGAAAVEQLGAVADQERRELEAALDRRLQRLPVAMLFPLALLILPGFLLVAVVPAVVGGIARLGI